MKKALRILSVSACFIGCVFYTSNIYSQENTITYSESSADFFNPERGFYRYSETKASSYTPLNQAELISRKSLHEVHASPQMSIYSSLVFRYFVLDDFIDASISQDFLDLMEADFNIVRAAGVKIIPRFAYTIEANQGTCGNFICPPYGDASKARVLEHISDLGEVLRNNADVIATIQMGFIGTWGEQYYTDFFGDASMSPFKLVDTNWEDRNEVLGSVLDNFPEERMIQVRYPQLKQRYVYGVNALTSSAALTSTEAYSGSEKSRIAFHNDCYLASDTDFGTYNDYGNSATSSLADTAALKPYLAAETRYVMMGGETCAANNPDDDCGQRADNEMRRMHFTYLNAEFNYPDVNSGWVDGGCMEDIKKNLGYRLHMEESTINYMESSRTLDFSFKIKNLGYSSPQNKRGLQLVMKNNSTSEEFLVGIPADPRTWDYESGTITVASSFSIPVYVPEGDYAFYLFLPDGFSSLYGNPDYAIRLATIGDATDVWDSATGYNKTGHSITLTSGDEDSIAEGINPSFRPCKNLTETYTVESSTDNSVSSLRDLILNAACGDTIFFASELNGIDIPVSGVPITIDKDIIIIGNGTSETQLDGQLLSRIFTVENQGHLYLENMTLKNGVEATDGGAILNDGYLFLKNVDLENNLEGSAKKALTNRNVIRVLQGVASEVKK